LEQTRLGRYRWIRRWGRSQLDTGNNGCFFGRRRGARAEARGAADGRGDRRKWRQEVETRSRSGGSEALALVGKARRRSFRGNLGGRIVLKSSRLFCRFIVSHFGGLPV